MAKQNALPPFSLIRSDRRSLLLQIMPDLTVRVRAPRHCPMAEIEQFVAAHTDQIAQHTERMRARQAAAALTPQQEQELRERAAQIIPQRVAFFSAQMGLVPTGVRITSAKTRFGSCSAKNSLCFSWRLMSYPPEAVDLVVVHELAHIRHHDHSPAFYALVERYLPDWRNRQALLRA